MPDVQRKPSADTRRSLDRHQRVVRFSEIGTRPGGFEPPTRGLEVRCSSTELRALSTKGTGGSGYLLAPKSAVTIVTVRPWKAPGADDTVTAPIPISRHSRERMFSRCGGLCIHSRTANPAP